MTKQEAKELLLEVWRYLAEHPETRSVFDLPKYLFKKLKPYAWAFYNPLCALFWKADTPHEGCPLKSCSIGTYYEDWKYPNSSRVDKKTSAQKIIDAIEAWNTEEVV